MDALLGTAFGATWLAVAGLGWFVYHLLRQNGRLLLRLEGLEAEVARSRVAADLGHVRGSRPLVQSRINREGLARGRMAPPFRLSRVDGRELSLHDFAGRRLLLVFSDPECAPCNAMAPRLERMYRANPRVEIVMISRRTPEANRAKVIEHGLTFPVVLQRSWEISREYGMFATPIAYLIDERGLIAADVAVGMDSILALLSSETDSVVAQRMPHLVSSARH